MPELPEVETVRRGLEPVLVGARLTAVDQRRPDLRFPLPERFAARLQGAAVEAVNRRAKYLLMPLSTGETWVTHLGMTGRFAIDTRVERGHDGGGEADAPGRFHNRAPVEERHAHLVLDTDRGDRVVFFDARRFGYMGLIPTAELAAHPWFEGLGPEPLGEGFSAAHLLRRFAGRIQAVKTALLDQRIVAGLGNIYVSEALHRAGIAPDTPAGRLSLPRLRRLVDAVRAVLEEAIEAGGSTLRDFANAEGELGYFQHRFRVYDREGAACTKPGCRGHVVRTVQGGRSTYACSACQR